MSASNGHGSANWTAEEWDDFYEKVSPKPRFQARQADPAQMKPIDFLWFPWLIRGALGLMAGEEGAGKSTMQARIAAMVTRGEIGGTPGNVLFIGADEDDWEQVVMPRLHAAGADMSRVWSFDAMGDFDMFDAVENIADLDAALQEREYALVVVEQVMDILPDQRNPNDPKAMRKALAPLRRCLRRRNVAGLITLHTNKAKAASLREQMQGSVQYGAVARSTFLVAKHPEDEERRVMVRGKGNYTAESESPALSFHLEEHVIDHGAETIRTSRAVDVRPEALDMSDVLQPGQANRDRERDEKREKVLEALTDKPQAERAIMRVTGLPKTTTHDILLTLKDDGLATQIKGEGWVVGRTDPLGDRPSDHPHEPPRREPREAERRQPADVDGGRA